MARAAGAVVVTKDSDFVDLLDRRGPPPQVVRLRVAALPAAGEPLVEVSGPAA